MKITLLTTYQCNLACKYCRVWSPNREYKEYSHKEMTQLIKKTCEVFQPDYVCFSGGEPFIRKDCIALLKIAGEYCDVGIFTNGTLITSSIAQILKSYQEKHGLTLTVSLDSHLEEVNDNVRGQYKNVLNGIKKLKQHKLDFGVAIVLTKQNASTILETLEYFHKNFTNEIHVLNLRPTYKVLENASELWLPSEERLKIWVKIIDYDKADQLSLYHPFLKSGIERCSASKLKLTVHPGGNITPCDLASDVILANVFETDIEAKLKEPPKWSCLKNVPRPEDWAPTTIKV